MRNRSIQLGRLHFHHTLLDWVGLWPLGAVAHRRRILYANESAVRLLGGQRPGDLIGKHVGRVYQPDTYSAIDRPSNRRALLRRLDGERFACEVLTFHASMLQRGITLMFFCPAAEQAAQGAAQPPADDFGSKYHIQDFTQSQIRNSLLFVRNNMLNETTEGSQPMVGTKVIDLNPPSSERSKRGVQKVFLHRCAVCQGEWVGYDANPGRCNYCHTPRWRTGKTKWDERREYDETVNDHPYDRETILDLAQGSRRGLTAFDILRELRLPHSRYDALRRTLLRMVADNQLDRVSRGRYSAPNGTPNGSTPRRT